MRSIWLGLAMALLLAGPGAAVGDEPRPDTTWYSLTADTGAVIGYASHESNERGDGRETVDTQEIVLADDENAPKRVTTRTVTKLDRSGRVTSITAISRTGRQWSRSETKVGEGRAVVARETAGGRRVTTVALPSGVRFDIGEPLLQSWDPGASPRLEFMRFDAGAAAVERVVIEPAISATPVPPGGMAVVRRRYDGDALIGISRLTLDAERRIVSITQPMFGAGITIRPTDRATALAPHPAYRALASVLTKSPFRILGGAIQGHIRYRFTFLDGLEFPFPQTGEQRASADAGGVTVDICEACGHGLATDKATLADALKPTAWLQSDHPRLRTIAGPVARLRVSDARKMEILTLKTQTYVARLDFTGHYTALDTLTRRAGDCTESAVLLAALGRAAGIPTRVANGLVYSRERYHGVSNVFMPHSWVVAYVDGQWRSYDAALERFDTTHIALTIGDGDLRSGVAAGQLSSLLRWDSMVEVKARSGN